MKKQIKIIVALLVIASLFSLFSCGEGEEREEITIALSRANLDMTVGDSYTLVPTISPVTHKNDPIEWKSTNPSVASCEGGVVSANSVGMATITASLRTDVYFSCRVNIIEDIDNIYMLVGETVPFTDTGLSRLDETAEYITSDKSVASVLRSDEGLMLVAHAAGRAILKLVGEKSELACYEIVVLGDDFGVTVNTDECKKTAEYNMTTYSTGVEIIDVLIDKMATRKNLASGCVEVHVTFRYKKAYDSDGDDAINPALFRYEIYSGEREGVLRSYGVMISEKSVSGGEIFEHTYKFEAVLDDGDGERTFTFKVLDSNG